MLLKQNLTKAKELGEVSFVLIVTDSINIIKIISEIIELLIPVHVSTPTFVSSL